MKQKSEQIKHDTTVGNNVERYASPRTKVLFVKLQEVLCLSNEPMREYDYGTGGFSEA